MRDRVSLTTVILTLTVLTSSPSFSQNAPPPPVAESAADATTGAPVNRLAIERFEAWRERNDRARAEHETNMATHRKLLEEAAAERRRYDAAKAAAEARMAAWTAEYGPQALAAKADRKPPRKTAAAPGPTTTVCRMVKEVGSTIPQRICTQRAAR